MFHGPAYQGVAELGPMGDDGVDGVIEVLPAPGALLDCAGQLMGWWVMQTEAVDRLAMPVQIARIAFFAAPPAAGRVACRVRMREVGEREVRADLELDAGDRLWARIDGWTDRRFDSDDPVWAILMYPERNVLAVPQPDGHVVVTEHWRAAASRELMMRRYLGERERAEFEALGPRRRRSWLLGRIAIKDAVRLRRWADGAGPLYPVEIEVANGPSGRPLVRGPGCERLRVSVAHKDDLAVALVTDAGSPGIDVERIEPRSDGFARIAFTERELALGGDRPRDEWMARLWTAKEAVAKARDTGLGDPRRFEVRAVDGDRLVVDGTPVETRVDRDLVVAWTQEPT
jgi:phosphopantetheinyl transferase